MEFKRKVWKTGSSKVITVPKDLKTGEEYEFDLVGKTKKRGVDDERFSRRTAKN